MERLAYKKDVLIKAYKACQRAINLYENPRTDVTEGELEAAVASLIKHFELLYEMMWKFFKLYLFITHGVEVTGSKTIFKACKAQDIITDDELAVLIDIVERRNTTTHLYDEESASDACEAIIEDFKIVGNIIERVAENILYTNYEN